MPQGMAMGRRHGTPCEVYSARSKSIGRFLGLPEKFIEKTPSDGLCGKTDEDNLGFSYDTLDKYIRYGVLPKAEIKSKIDNLHKKNEFNQTNAVF